jgi:hypothetical protein
VFPARYEMGSFMPEDGILHSHWRENLEYYIFSSCLEFRTMVDNVRKPSDSKC